MELAPFWATPTSYLSPLFSHRSLTSLSFVIYLSPRSPISHHLTLLPIPPFSILATFPPIHLSPFSPLTLFTSYPFNSHPIYLSPLLGTSRPFHLSHLSHLLLLSHLSHLSQLSHISEFSHLASNL